MDLDLESTNSLLQNHEGKNMDTFPRPGSSSLFWRASLQYLFCFLAGCIPALLMIISAEYKDKSVSSYISPFPEMPQETRLFEWDYVFSGLPSAESDAAWASLLPFGRGYVFVEEPTKYGLPAGETTPNGEIYSIALYHQLHCLRIIRHDYFGLLEGVMNNDTSVRTLALDQIDTSHNRHCMDYLRQTLECYGDTTLEWQRFEKDGTRFQVDGMHIPHQCKAKKSINEFMTIQKGLVDSERKLQKTVGV